MKLSLSIYSWDLGSGEEALLAKIILQCVMEMDNDRWQRWPFLSKLSCKFCNLYSSWSRRGMAVHVSLCTQDSIHPKQVMSLLFCSYRNIQLQPMRKYLMLVSNSSLRTVDNSCNLALFLWAQLNTVITASTYPLVTTEPWPYLSQLSKGPCSFPPT